MSENRFDVELVDSDDVRWNGQKAVVVDRVDKDIICECIESDDARRIAAALNAAPQAEKAREIIERAGTLLAQSKAWIYSCKKRAGAQESALADTRMGEIDQLLADIAAYKEG